MPQPEKFYYADGRKIPIEADPNRMAVRYREEPAGATRDMAQLAERESAEQSTGAVSRAMLRLEIDVSKAAQDKLVTTARKYGPRHITVRRASQARLEAQGDPGVRPNSNSARRPAST